MVLEPASKRASPISKITYQVSLSSVSSWVPIFFWTVSIAAAFAVRLVGVSFQSQIDVRVVVVQRSAAAFLLSISAAGFQPFVAGSCRRWLVSVVPVSHFVAVFPARFFSGVQLLTGESVQAPLGVFVLLYFYVVASPVRLGANVPR